MQGWGGGGWPVGLGRCLELRPRARPPLSIREAPHQTNRVLGVARMEGLIYLAIIVGYVMLSRALVRQFKSRPARWAIVAVAILIPTWDWIPGYLYFQHVCKAEGGFQVYGTATIEPQDIKNGYPDTLLLADRFLFDNQYVRKAPDPYPMSRATLTITDNHTGAVLGRASRFVYRGPWLLYLMNGGEYGSDPGASCPSWEDSSGKLLLEVFKRVPQK